MFSKTRKNIVWSDFETYMIYSLRFCMLICKKNETIKKIENVIFYFTLYGQRKFHKIGIQSRETSKRDV